MPLISKDLSGQNQATAKLMQNPTVQALLQKSKSTSLAGISPLRISQGSSEAGMSSFKETWNQENYQASMQKSRMYEAGGSLFWLGTGLPCSILQWLPAEEPSLGGVLATAVAFLREEEGPGQEVHPLAEEEKRLYFPFPFETYVLDIPGGF